jgi:hypothetical protein
MSRSIKDTAIQIVAIVCTTKLIVVMTRKVTVEEDANTASRPTT